MTVNGSLVTENNLLSGGWMTALIFTIRVQLFRSECKCIESVKSRNGCTSKFLLENQPAKIQLGVSNGQWSIMKNVMKYYNLDFFQ